MKDYVCCCFSPFSPVFHLGGTRPTEKKVDEVKKKKKKTSDKDGTVVNAKCTSESLLMLLLFPPQWGGQVGRDTTTSWRKPTREGELASTSSRAGGEKFKFGFIFCGELKRTENGVTRLVSGARHQLRPNDYCCCCCCWPSYFVRENNSF